MNADKTKALKFKQPGSFFFLDPRFSAFIRGSFFFSVPSVPSW